MNGQPSDFSKRTFKTFILRILTQVFTVGAGIIIARSLGPSGKGMFTYATTVLALILSLAAGAGAAVSWQYGRLQRPSKLVYAAVLKFLALVCVPIGIALAAAGVVTHQPSLLAAAIAFPFAYLNQVSIGFALADNDVTFANIQGLVTALGLTVVAGVLCYGLHLGVGEVLTGWVAVNAAVCAYSIVRLARYTRGSADAEGVNVFREHAHFSLRVTLNQLLAMLNFQIDVFIVLFVMGHAWLGRYSIAVGVGAMMWQLSRPLTATSYGSVTRGTPQEAARITVLCVRHALFSVGVACLVLASIGPWLLELVYGQAFAASGRALQLLLPGVIAYCTVPFFAQYFTLQLGKPGINTAIIATSTVVCAGITLLLIHQHGILAGAIGTSISYTVDFMLCAAIFCRNARVAPLSLFAFGASDLEHYVLLMRWIVSGLRAARRAG